MGLCNFGERKEGIKIAIAIRRGGERSVTLDIGKTTTQRGEELFFMTQTEPSASLTKADHLDKSLKTCVAGEPNGISGIR